MIEWRVWINSLNSERRNNNDFVVSKDFTYVRFVILWTLWINNMTISIRRQIKYRGNWLRFRIAFWCVVNISHFLFHYSFFFQSINLTRRWKQVLKTSYFFIPIIYHTGITNQSQKSITKKERRQRYFFYFPLFFSFFFSKITNTHIELQ